jgi:hypothetical protein
MSTVVLVIAASFAVMGLAALARPEQILAYFGTPTLTLDGRNEVRAVYGGFGVAIAVLLASVASAPAYAPGVLLCTAVALYGMAAGRLFSFVADRAAGTWPRVFFVVEVAAATALMLALPG